MTFLIIQTITLIFALLFFYSFHNNQTRKERREQITKFPSYIIVLEHHLEKAYQIIYKDKILIYSMEGSKVDDKNFNMILKDFTNLVLKLLGPTLKNEFINLYGDYDTFLLNILEYFNSKYEEDEVRKASVESIMEKDTVED